ncbi:DUF2269 family protein [Aliamphritea hakodatensis]|uniref:DUF2269 family protein n=1 Tax=Aliamphritea hakodatensis TaxID=2895352 RepID=UPI0022FD7268|nr:DUF2269 domain-containing protein [Aliamphritea hakodatensis]
MSLYLTVKTLHILSAAVLFGTGAGIAFFMFRSYFSSDSRARLFAARNTVLADYLFTLPAAIFQPISGIWLISQAGYNWNAGWLLTSYVLYLLIGLCWLPVVRIQIMLKQQLNAAHATGNPLPANHKTLFHWWIALGIPAFISILLIFFLMVLKPV